MSEYLAELEREAATTRRLLELVPEDRLAWKPHPKSMSLGQLALHVATIPGGVSGMVGRDVVDLEGMNMEQAAAETPAQILRAFEESLAGARDFLGGLDAARAAATWRVVRGPREIMAMPRAVAVRAILLNHWYHHRGQLGVYLRLLDVPLPAVYGRSADENPLA